MMAEVQILISATDQASAVLKRTANLTNDVANAMTRLIVQERNNRILAEADKQFKNLTETEKKAALAAYDLAEAQNRVTEESANVGNQKSSWTELKSAIDLAVGAARTVYSALKQVYDVGKEGAALDYAAIKFGRLSTAAKTTANVLLTDLRAATSGMLSDSELMAQAGDMMALGLAKTGDEIIRLTTVASALGMDMNQLVLTLTNQTTMRFDALGVSVDGFDAKVQQLKDSGMDASAAFQEAFLQQAEAQLDKIGGKADTDAGKIARMEAAVKNMGDAWKLAVAPAVADAAEGLADYLNTQIKISELMAQDAGSTRDQNPQKRRYDALKLAEAMKEAAAANEAWNSSEREQMAIEKAAGPVITKKVETGQSLANTYGSIADQMRSSIDPLNLYSDGLNNTRQAMTLLEEKGGDLLYSQDRMQDVLANMSPHQYAKAMQQMVDASKNLEDAQSRLADATADFNQSYSDKVAGALEKAEVKGESYTKALELLDKQNGTNLLGQYKANEALEKAIEQYKKDGDVDTFSKAIAGNKSEWELLDEKVQGAKRALDEARASFGNLMTDIANAAGKTWTITVKTNSTGGAPAGVPQNTPGNPTNPGTGDYAYARGGDFIVPPGYENDRYRMRVSTGEHVTVTPPGQDTGPTRSVVYNIFSKESPGQIRNALTLSAMMGGAS